MAFKAILAPKSSNATESKSLEKRSGARVYIIFNL